MPSAQTLAFELFPYTLRVSPPSRDPELLTSCTLSHPPCFRPSLFAAPALDSSPGLFCMLVARPRLQHPSQLYKIAVSISRAGLFLSVPPARLTLARPNKAIFLYYLSRFLISLPLFFLSTFPSALLFVHSLLDITKRPKQTAHRFAVQFSILDLQPYRQPTDGIKQQSIQPLHPSAASLSPVAQLL